MGRYVLAMCKLHTILYKGLGHSWILVSGAGGSSNQSPVDTKKQLCIFSNGDTNETTASNFLYQTNIFTGLARPI